MKKRRWCHEVIDQMLLHVPQDKKGFIEALNWNRKDSLCKAPEEIIQWYRTMETLRKFILKPKQDWEFEVISIFTTTSIDKLKKLFKE